MNKSIIFLFVFLLSVVCVSGLTSYANCTSDGNHYVCTDGLPNPNTNFGDKGVLITGNITFTSSNGVSSSPDAEDINLVYTIPSGVEIKNANIRITSGVGVKPSSEQTGGFGGNINISFATSKFRMSNSTIVLTTGGGGDGQCDTSGSCDNNGGDSGTIVFNSGATNYLYILNSSISSYTGNGGNGDVYTSGTGYGGGAGYVTVILGTNTSINSINNFTIYSYGGNGGATDVDSSGARCARGGFGTSYYFYLYGNTDAYLLDYKTSNTSTISDSTCVSATDDSDSTTGGAGRPSTVYLYNITMNNSIINTSGLHSSDCRAIASGAAEDSCDGLRGGNVELYGTSFIAYNSRVLLSSGNGGDADYDTDLGGACGGGGNININFLTYNLYNTSQVLTIGDSGVAVGDTIQHHQGGSGGSVSYYTNSSFIDYNNNITFTSRSGCEAGSDAGTTTYGSQFFIYGGNVTFYNVYFAGHGGNNSATGEYLESGGVVAFSGDQLSVSNSNLSLIGGNRGLISTGNSGYGMINFSNVSIVNSYVRLHKGNNGTDTTGYQAKFLTNGSGMSIFSNSTISLTKGDIYGKNNTFNISNIEVRFYNNTILNYTGVAPTWSTYADYVYINNATVQSTMQIYNKTTNATIIRYNVSQVGTWTFNGASTGYVLNQYFSRISNVTVSYNTVVPIRNSNYTCSSNYTLGNGSVSSAYYWFVNGTYRNTGVNLTGSVGENANITCLISLYDTGFNMTSNTTTVVNYAYPYNAVFSVDGETLYTYSGFLNSTSVNLSLDVGGFNRYIQYVCNGTLDNCSIPIVITNGVDISNVNITNITLVYGVSPVGTGDIVIPFVLESSQSGDINVSNVSFNIMNGNECSIQISYNKTDGTNGTYYMTIRDSSVNLSIVPNGVEYWDVLPYKSTQQDVTPIGQTSTTPIFNLSYSANNPFYVYMRFTSGLYPPCANTTVNSNRTNTLGWLINESYTSIGVLNSTNSYMNLWTWTDFNCTYNQIKVFYPEIDFKTLCTDCVLTEDFYD